jgi:hypothetical protein
VHFLRALEEHRVGKFARRDVGRKISPTLTAQCAFARSSSGVISAYVYVMQFTGDKISHMTKIWHSGMALKELGWA